jgi:hypothetical protein
MYVVSSILIVSFGMQNLPTLVQSHLSIFICVACALESHQKTIAYASDLKWFF